MEMNENKLNDEELEEYFNAFLKEQCEYAVQSAVYDKIEKEDLQGYVIDKIYLNLITRMGYDKNLLRAKRNKKFEKKDLVCWLYDKDLGKKYEEMLERHEDMNAENAPLMRSILENEETKKDIKEAIEKSIILNPDIDRKKIVKTVCNDFLKKAQEREDKIEEFEFNLKKAVSTLFSMIPDNNKKLYKSIYKAVESKTEDFPFLFLDAFTILEYMKQGGTFVDPIMSIPVHYKDIGKNIAHSQGDGDVYAKEG